MKDLVYVFYTHENNPIYTRVKSLGDDVSIEELRKDAARSRSRGNMLPLAKEEDFFRLKNEIKK